MCIQNTFGGETVGNSVPFGLNPGLKKDLKKVEKGVDKAGEI